jgi:gluconate 2-dehydrogenase gamma chain
MTQRPGRVATKGLGLSRRDFLVGGAGLWIAVSLPRTRAAAEAAAHSEPIVLAPQEWRTVEAITGRILPTDDTPGALEAGCVNFIDKVLAGEDAVALPAYRSALAELDRLCRIRFEADFAALPATRQDRVLAELETGTIDGWSADAAAPEGFFATVRMHTILGFVLDPRHGGNRDYVGWKTMGFPGPVHHLGGARPEHMSGEEPFVPIWARSGEEPEPSG